MEPAPDPTLFFDLPTLSEACPTFTVAPVEAGEHIPRPPNAWLIFRSWRGPRLPPVAAGEPARDAKLISKMCAMEWKDNQNDVKVHFSQLAREAKEIHKARYPDYKYKPDRRSKQEKARERGKRRGNKGRGKSPMSGSATRHGESSSKSRSTRGVERKMTVPWNPERVAWNQSDLTSGYASSSSSFPSPVRRDTKRTVSSSAMSTAWSSPESSTWSLSSTWESSPLHRNVEPTASTSGPTCYRQPGPHVSSSNSIPEPVQGHNLRWTPIQTPDDRVVRPIQSSPRGFQTRISSLLSP